MPKKGATMALKHPQAVSFAVRPKGLADSSCLQWAHSGPLAAYFWSNDGLFCDHQQYLLAASMGPCMGISRISQEKQWAHL